VSLQPVSEKISADRRLVQGRALLYGLTVNASQTGGDVSLYEGQDAGSGRLIGTYTGEGSISNPIMFPVPLPLERGLFVDIGENISYVTVIFQPLWDLVEPPA